MQRREFLKILGACGVVLAAPSIRLLPKQIKIAYDSHCPEKEAYILGDTVVVHTSLHDQLNAIFKEIYTPEVMEELIFRSNPLISLMKK